MTCNKEKSSKKKYAKRVILILCIFAFLLVSCDMRLKTVVYSIDSTKVDHKITIALITDLHSCRYGKHQHTLMEAVDRQKPDIVLLGGDIFDDKRENDRAEETVKYLAKRYPCYYVTGNHEYWSHEIDSMLTILESYGVTCLSGECAKIQVNGEMINLCGIDDPETTVYTDEKRDTDEQLASAVGNANSKYYTILLAHRPELIEIYQKYNFDLVLSGHAHGGQWRIPGILNGLYAPHQGMFPKYAGGRYELGNTTMIVSRGLARESTMAPRIFNRPELVIVEIGGTSDAW